MDTVTLRQGADGEWRWTRRAHGNNEIIAASTEGYKRKTDALANIRRTQGGDYMVEESFL